MESLGYRCHLRKLCLLLQLWMLQPFISWLFDRWLFDRWMYLGRSWHSLLVIWFFVRYDRVYRAELVNLSRLFAARAQSSFTRLPTDAALALLDVPWPVFYLFLLLWQLLLDFDAHTLLKHSCAADHAAFVFVLTVRTLMIALLHRLIPNRLPVWMAGLIVRLVRVVIVAPRCPVYVCRWSPKLNVAFFVLNFVDRVKSICLGTLGSLRLFVEPAFFFLERASLDAFIFTDLVARRLDLITAFWMGLDLWFFFNLDCLRFDEFLPSW